MKNSLTAILLGGLMLILAVCDTYVAFEDDGRVPSADDLALAAAEVVSITPVNALPDSGFVSYSGVIRAETSGDFDGSLYADLDVAADFDAGKITGTITNTDLVDDATGEVAQSLTDTLTVAGTQATNVVSVSGSGQLTGLPGGEDEGVSTAGLVLVGSVRSDATDADTV